MRQVLIVEDSKLFGSILKNEIESALRLNVDWAETFADAATLINNGNSNYFLGLLDLNLPDAPMGEIVDFVLSKNIPSIVFTADLTKDVREEIWAKNVVDYVLKEGTQSIDYIISLIDRIHKNKNIKILVVDDTQFYKKVILDLLKVHQYDVLEAGDGKEALEVLKNNPDIRLILTDYNMPNMNGFELTKNIRIHHKRDEISIIGLSDQADSFLSAQFIKYGANDFINKPFLNEEFYCRITQAIETIENVKKIKELSNKDYLTGLFNRRFFFESGNKMYASAYRKHITMSIAILDIDYFKNINDTHGHDSGDEVLKNLGQLLEDRFRTSDIVARVGGEEFCILLANNDINETYAIFENLRETIEESIIKIGQDDIKYTVSIGVCTKLMDSLEEMIKQADLMLYKAKEGGRNRIEILT